MDPRPCPNEAKKNKLRNQEIWIFTSYALRPILQIFEQDHLNWFQWLENVSKLIRITLESRKVKSNGEKPNSEKIPISLTYT